MHLLRRPTPPADFSDIRAGRNPSYLNSLFLGFERGVFRAPSSLLNLIGWPLLSIAIALLYVGVGLVLWVLVRVYFVVFGLLGLLRLNAAPGSKSVLSDKL